MNNPVPPIVKPDPSKTLGGIPKIKFKPKVPSKKQEVVKLESEAGESSKLNDNTNRRAKYNSGGDRGRGRKPGGRGSGERDRNNSNSRFVMPTGEAFFQGGGATSSSTTTSIKIGLTKDNPSTTGYASVGSGGAPVKTELSVDASGSIGGRPDLTSQLGGIPEPMQRDEDDETPGNVLKATYDSLGPVSLPFHRLVTPATDKPLFAPAGDLTAMYTEEQESLYLLQLPSDLTLRAPTLDTDADIGASASDASCSKPGPLGKMKIFASGRIVLCTKDGRQFEVNGGLKASFLQHVATVNYTSSPPATEATPTDPAPRGSKGPAQVVEEAAGGRVLGSLAFLGSVTEKLVVVSDLVTRNGGSKGSSSSSSARVTSSSSRNKNSNVDIADKDEQDLLDRPLPFEPDDGGLSD